MPTTHETPNDKLEPTRFYMGTFGFHGLSEVRTYAALLGMRLLINLAYLLSTDYAASERFVLPEFNLGRRMLSISSPPPIPVIPFDEDFFARGWSAKYPSSRVFNIVQSDILRVGLEHYFPHHDVRITISDGGLREACITVGDKVIYHGYEGIPIRYFVTAYAGRNRRFAFYQVTGMDRSQSRTCIGDAEWPPFILAVPLRCASILRQSPSRFIRFARLSLLLHSISSRLPNTATHSSDLDVRRDANPNSNDPDSLQIGGSVRGRIFSFTIPRLLTVQISVSRHV